MRRLIFSLGLLLLVATPASAQDYPKGEVFGGFSLFSIGNGGRENLYGLQTSISGNFHRNVGFTANLGGQFKSIAGISLQTYELLLGPRFTARTERVTGFGHTLVGVAVARASGGGFSETETGFALGFGGGVDVNASDRVAIRVFQFDWIPTRFDSEWSFTNVRLGVGVVFKWGGS